MDSNFKSELLNEYFDTVAPLLIYESCETTLEMERKALGLLCEMKGRADLFDECWKMIEGAECLQTCADIALLDSSDSVYDNIACDIKRESLVEANIKKLKRFNENGFVEDVKTNANFGDISSCKLLAVMNWLGCLLPQNKATSKRIWSFLAMSGNLFSAEMLINALGAEEEKAQRQRWEHIKNILESEYNSFSAIATYSNYPAYTEEEVQTANLIMFISQKSAKSEDKAINRQMIQYLLDSGDDYKTKMSKISSDTNYYLVMHAEGKKSKKECGF